jgi:hypothetical protein
LNVESRVEIPPDARTAQGSIMAQVVEKTTAEEESTFHAYTGNAIPWYLRLLWILFWCGAIAYVVTRLLPTLQSELLAPP